MAEDYSNVWRVTAPPSFSFLAPEELEDKLEQQGAPFSYHPFRSLYGTQVDSGNSVVVFCFRGSIRKRVFEKWVFSNIACPEDLSKLTVIRGCTNDCLSFEDTRVYSDVKLLSYRKVVPTLQSLGIVAVRRRRPGLSSDRGEKKEDEEDEEGEEGEETDLEEQEQQDKGHVHVPAVAAPSAKRRCVEKTEPSRKKATVVLLWGIRGSGRTMFAMMFHQLADIFIVPPGALLGSVLDYYNGQKVVFICDQGWPLKYDPTCRPPLLNFLYSLCANDATTLPLPASLNRGGGPETIYIEANLPVSYDWDKDMGFKNVLTHIVSCALAPPYTHSYCLRWTSPLFSKELLHPGFSRLDSYFVPVDEGTSNHSLMQYARTYLIAREQAVAPLALCESDGEEEGGEQKKKRAPRKAEERCRCGSKEHLRITHTSCPLNPLNNKKSESPVKKT
jgi:hypothetical protein